MSFEEKRKYECERKLLQRQKRKIMSLQSSTNDERNESSDVNEDEDDETDFSFDGSVNKEEAGAIINMIQNSPTKKRKTEKALFNSLQEYCADFTDNEVVDLLVVLAQACLLAFMTLSRKWVLKSQIFQKGLK